MQMSLIQRRSLYRAGDDAYRQAQAARLVGRRLTDGNQRIRMAPFPCRSALLARRHWKCRAPGKYHASAQPGAQQPQPGHRIGGLRMQDVVAASVTQPGTASPPRRIQFTNGKTK